MGRIKLKLINFNLLFFLVGLCLLGGCTNQDKVTELQKYVASIKKRQIKEIEPLPEVKPYETFTYEAFDNRSPFVPPKPEEVVMVLPEDNGIRPDTNRRKEALESYAIDALRMVGTIERDNKLWAIVVDPDGTVHRITKGNYVGQNHGRVNKINEESLDLTEIVPDGRSGGWRERKASMTLSIPEEQASTQ